MEGRAGEDEEESHVGTGEESVRVSVCVRVCVCVWGGGRGQRLQADTNHPQAALVQQIIAAYQEDLASQSSLLLNTSDSNS